MNIAPAQYSLAPVLNPSSPQEAVQSTSNKITNVTKPTAVDPVLGEAQSQLSTFSEVDMDKVNAMRESLRTGKMTIDVDSLAGAMQNYFQR